MSGPNLAMMAQMDPPALGTILEHDFAVAVREYAEARGWVVGYMKRTGYLGKDGKWKGMAPKGEPDHRFARNGVYFAAELKTETGTQSPAQLVWGAALGPHGRLWRPRDAEAIMKELKEG